MKILKGILITLGLLIALVLIVALFVKKDFTGEAEIVIERPQMEVYNYIRHLKHQENYGTWYQMDPDMDIRHSGTDGTVGFTTFWEGDRMGEGSQRIVNLIPGERMDTKLRFVEPMESEMDSYMLTSAVNPNETKVIWGMKGRTPYPFNLMNLFMDYGKDFQEGLQNLKGVMESPHFQPDPGITIDTAQQAPGMSPGSQTPPVSPALGGDTAIMDTL